MKKLIPFILIGLVACDQKPNEAILDPESNASYTKTMVYAVDLNSVFHEDLNDEGADFEFGVPVSDRFIAQSGSY